MHRLGQHGVPCRLLGNPLGDAWPGLTLVAGRFPHHPAHVANDVFSASGPSRRPSDETLLCLLRRQNFISSRHPELLPYRRGEHRGYVLSFRLLTRAEVHAVSSDGLKVGN